MSNLFNIGKEFQDLMDLLDHELMTEGQISDETSTALEIKREELGEKVANYRWVITTLDSHENMAKTEIDRINGFVKRVQNKKEALKKALLYALINYGDEQANGVRKLEFDTVKLSTRKSKVVQVKDETEVPEAHKTFTIKVSGSDWKSVSQVLEDLGIEYTLKDDVSKTSIKDTLNAGIAVPGAYIEERVSLQIK